MSFPDFLHKEYLAKLGGWPVLQAAQRLVDAGAVEEAGYAEPFLLGKVRSANGPVTSRIKISARLFEVENKCSCPQARRDGTICVHAVALGLAVISPTRSPHSAPRFANPNLTKPNPPLTPLPIQAKNADLFLLKEESSVSPALDLHFLLPLDFSAAWQSGQIRIIVEASIHGQPTRPLDSVLRSLQPPYYLTETSLPAMRFLAATSAVPLPSLFLLPRARFTPFFTALAGHQNVMLGKRSPVTIQTAADLPKITVSLLPDGSWKLALAREITAGEWLTTPTARWFWSRGTLRSDVVSHPVLSRLAEGEVILKRTEVARFYQEELENLRAIAHVALDSACTRLELVETSPKIRLTLDGTSAALSTRLEAIYEAETIPLTGPSLSTSVTWNPDPKNPLRYVARVRAAECSAHASVLSAGFAPGARDTTCFVLSGESVVFDFLANTWPVWKTKSWEILIEPRLQKLLQKCDWIEPAVTIRPSGEDWLSLEMTYASAQTNAALSPGEVQQLLQSGRAWQRQNSGRISLVPTAAVSEWMETLHDCTEEAGAGDLQVARAFSPYLREALKTAGVRLTAMSSWSPPARLAPIPSLALSAHLKTVLRPYQQEGVQWLHGLAVNKFGGILADEMGLGKTLQTLAYLSCRRAAFAQAEHAKTPSPRRPTLIVCPTSLLTNWVEEAAQFTPELRTLRLHGAERTQDFARMTEVDIVITSYALLRRDLAVYAAQHFDSIILDEAQQIKNRASQVAQAVKLLRADLRLVLTGTPLENSLFDLWSIFDFLMPGYLGTAPSFRERYELPVTRGGDAAVQARLNARLRPFVLRRTKSEVARELPEKISTVRFTELTGEQQKIYQAVLEAGRREVFELAGAGNAGKRTMAMLTVLTRLRQVSCHLALLPTEPGKIWAEPSGKLELLMEMMEEATEGGHRVLVFSQFVHLLKLVSARFTAEKIDFCYLDGATVDRAGEVARFQNGTAPVFLISLKAGGTGLNLTAADTVILLDPWWNPAVEEQATARAHRIGQKKVVTSYKLIAKGTVEEKILALQERKRALAAGTLEDAEGMIGKLSPEEWAELMT